MSERSERLYNDLKTERDLKRLIGKSEDGDFDCKVWPDRSDAARGTIAKAACGFANATGGVIIIGMRASGATSDSADVVEGLAPIADREPVASEALNIILKFVEPGIAGVQSKTITREDSEKDGYILIHIPESEGAPRRTKTDWKFYVRITSGTVPMEYFQIEDRFGRRPHPRLTADIASEEERTIHPVTGPFRAVKLVLRNDGLGIARFPCLRIRQGSGFSVSYHAEERPLWNVYNNLAGWTSIRGGSNDVIYPGEILPLATIMQKGLSFTCGPRDYDAANVEVEVLCDGTPPHRQTLHFPAKTYTF
jgi:hypothetical protein